MDYNDDPSCSDEPQYDDIPTDATPKKSPLSKTTGCIERTENHLDATRPPARGKGGGQWFDSLPGRQHGEREGGNGLTPSLCDEAGSPGTGRGAVL